MRRSRTMVAGCATLLAASLLLARIHPFGDAGLSGDRATAESLQAGSSSIPADARAVLMSKCADCHSAQPRVPIYGHFAPISWLVERDIVEGRKAMNLSRWSSYSEAERQTFAAKIFQETKANAMPLPQYRWMHPAARINDADLRTLKDWARIPAANGPDGSAAGGIAGDPARGKEVFEKRCTGCHSLTQDREGPRLHDVYGRVSGTVAGFDYSPALKNAAILWNEETLERWLSDPDAFVPGNNMEFQVVKPQERVDIIAFLKKSAAR